MIIWPSVPLSVKERERIRAHVKCLDVKRNAKFNRFYIYECLYTPQLDVSKSIFSMSTPQNSF